MKQIKSVVFNDEFDPIHSGHIQCIRKDIIRK